VNHEAYNAAPGVRWSNLKHMSDSPAHYQAAVNREFGDSDTLIFGRLLHTMVLQPHLMDAEYVVWSDGRRAGKAWTDFVEAAGDRQIVRQRDIDEATPIADAIRSHPALADLWEGAIFETAVFWEHTSREIVVPMKAMLDWYHPATRTLIDLKTCRTADRRMFARAVADYGYHGQMAHYREGARRNNMPVDRVLIVAAEKGTPHDVVPYEMCEGGAMRMGESYRDELVSRLVWCTATGKWPGRSDVVEPLEMPSWADPDADLDLEITGDSDE
jgi:hypothetical protein